jgi:hypothetical protein
LSHIFTIGQTVVLTTHLPGNLAQAGSYEVVRHLPVDAHGEPQYRIKSVRETHERVVRESQLDSSTARAPRLSPA